MNNPTQNSINNSLLTANHMKRPRVEAILDKATRSKLVYVIAGAGYGKTQAIYHYIKNQNDAIVRWLQLSEGDNVGSHYWESLTHNISLDNPDLAARLREAGFPETPARFKQFAEILKNSEHRSNKTYLVLDDFHLIHSQQALTFAERCAYLHIPGACVIILSRKEPEINAVSLFSKGQACMITEDDLRFTNAELIDFMKLCNIPFTSDDLAQYIDATRGWALAIKLLSLVLIRTPGNLSHAIDIMKQNINKLLEIEAFNAFPENVRKILVQLSLVADLPLTPLNAISENGLFIQDMPQLASFMWFDSFVGDYRVHPLYHEFLQSKQNILSEEEIQNTYRWAAQWCCENGFYMDAMNYYAKSRQYSRMLSMFLSYPFKLPPDTCEFYLNIMEKIDRDDTEDNNSDILMLKNLITPLLYMGTGKYDQARERSMDIVRKWENLDTPASSYILYTAYSNLAYIDTYICTVTHNYDFAKYLKKAVDFYKSSSSPPVNVSAPFGVADIRSFACLVGEGADLDEFGRFLETARETAVYIEQTYHCMYYGYDDLIACEIEFFKNNLDQSRSFALNAVLKAREKKQYSIEAMAQYYLLRIAIHEGDYSLTREILRQARNHLENPNFWNRQLLYDLFVGSFYCHVGLPKMVSPWLAIDEKETTSEVSIPARELIVSVRYYLASKKYKQALAILCNSYPRYPQERFYFGELIFTLLLSVARLKTGDTAGALKDFQAAYTLSFDGVLEMPFVELGKSFHSLSTAAAKHSDCTIPVLWMKKIDRKASIYAKKSAFIMDLFKEEKHINDTVALSAREQEVLNDLYHGLSRDEIAANRYLSINTVKKMLQSIYIKLDAKNNVDAIRIAIEKKLVD